MERYTHMRTKPVSRSLHFAASLMLNVSDPMPRLQYAKPRGREDRSADAHRSAFLACNNRPRSKYSLASILSQSQGTVASEPLSNLKVREGKHGARVDIKQLRHNESHASSVMSPGLEPCVKDLAWKQEHMQQTTKKCFEHNANSYRSRPAITL